MNKGKRSVGCLIAALGLLLVGCGGKAQTPKEGMVYLDPNAAPAVTSAPAAPSKGQEPPVTAGAASGEPGGESAEVEQLPELYFESKGVRIIPAMEAGEILAALGDPIASFEADSCAYVGKDLFYHYPGFQLTVNDVGGVNRITSINVVDDTIVTPQGLRIGDGEEKLLSLLGGEEADGVYSYESGDVLLIIEVKDSDTEERRIASMEYRVAEDWGGAA